MSTPAGSSPAVAFVLGGGGGSLGAHEVGMLRALLERGIVPDLVLGTSVGAINGVAVAADPTTEGVARLARMWSAIDASAAFDGSLFKRLGTLARTRTHLHRNDALRATLAAPQTVEVRLWHEPAAHVPARHEEQIDWLFGWWRMLDAWVRDRHEAVA